MSLLLIVVLVDAPYQTRMLPLYSHFPWRAVAGAEAASLVIALPRIQRFLFVFELASRTTNLFVVMAALGEARLVGAASVGCVPSVYLVLF